MEVERNTTVSKIRMKYIMFKRKAKHMRMCRPKYANMKETNGDAYKSTDDGNKEKKQMHKQKKKKK